MSRKKTEPKPNYELMFKSAVLALQTTYSAYKVAREKELYMSWYGDDGSYRELEGIGKVRVTASELLHEINMLKAQVEEYRRLMEREKDEGL